MSLRALTWAMEHPGCPTSSCKLVLLAFANFANEQHWSYPSVETIARLTKLDPKTVRTSIDTLERADIALIVDTGKRAGRTRQVKVYELAMERHPETDGLPKAPENGGLSDRKAPNISGKGTRNRVAEPVLGTPIPPSEAKASAAPQGAGGGEDDRKEDGGKPKAAKRRQGARLPDDWTPPPLDTLSPAVQAIVRQWPPGAYEFVAAQFIAHWTAESGYRASKLDWKAAWTKWLTAESARILAAKRNGIDFSRALQAVDPGLAGRRESSAEEGRLIEAQAEECAVATAIRAALQAECGERTYDGWLRATMILIEEDPPIVTVLAATGFMRDWIAQHFTERIARIAARHLKGPVPRVLVKVSVD